MKKILLIDGENFVHSVVRSLQKSKIIRMRSQLHRLDCRYIFNKIAAGKFADIAYYSTKIQIRSAPEHLRDSLDHIRAWNAKWVPYLANQNIRFVKAGNLKVRDAKRCPHCHKSASVLQEKGVDVRLAVDIVARAGRGVELFVLSSDVDLFSALEAAKLRGAKVNCVIFEDAGNRALLQTADKQIIIKDKDVVRAFKKVNP